MEDVAKLKIVIDELQQAITTTMSTVESLCKNHEAAIRVAMQYYDNVLRLLVKNFPEEYKHLAIAFAKDNPELAKAAEKELKKPVEVMYQ